MQKKSVFLVVTAVACVACVGCQMSPVQKSGLAGGAIGAAVGGVLGGTGGTLSIAKSAGVGVCAGTTVGAGVEVGQSDQGITRIFVTEVMFASGKPTLTRVGIESLRRAGRVIRERYPNNEINIEGHADNVPTKLSGYRSNWELSTDRAAAVLHYLVEEEGLRPELLSITGYGGTRPVAPNDTALGQRLNRRAVLVILPDVKY